MQKLFVDPEILPGGDNCPPLSSYCTEEHAAFYGGVQVFFLMLIYAFVLSWSSNMISDGSELLLLVPSWRGLVGSIVLPILGAVPDGAIVLFSGLGDDAATQVNVGVGALAGSTIMLLTIPWFLSILAGRVDMTRDATNTLTPNYGKSSGGTKLNPRASTMEKLFKTGVSLQSQAHFTGKLMVLTSLTYLIIQAPAFYELDNDADIKSNATNSTNSQHRIAIEQSWALTGLIIAVIAFLGYIVYQVRYANFDEAAERAQAKAIENCSISLSGIFVSEFRDVLSNSGANADETGSLLPPEERKFKAFLKKKFDKFDLNGDGEIDAKELLFLFKSFNENPTEKEIKAIIAKWDKDGNGVLSFDEFCSSMITYIKDKENKSVKELANEFLSVNNKEERTRHLSEMETKEASNDDVDDEDEEEDEVPEDIAQLSPDQQQSRIKLRAMWMMALGTTIVLVFSDPMVDVLSSLGARTGIKPFYIAFVLSPLASNASELIAAYNYASKKTRKTINISFATLEGAAIMNNTFCLGIFLFVIYLKGLEWTFSAETISILVIQVLMAIYAQKKSHRLIDGFVILSFYPLSLFLVYMIENFSSLT